MEWRLAAQYDPATRSADSWMHESQPTSKLRCAASANPMTHGRCNDSWLCSTDFAPRTGVTCSALLAGFSELQHDSRRWCTDASGLRFMQIVTHGAWIAGSLPLPLLVGA
jgi:hypothetical protein